MSLSPDAERLEQRLTSQGPALIAYSGGVDSAVLAFACRRALGREKSLAVIATGPSLPRREQAEAVAFAARHDLALLEIAATEFSDQNFLANRADRCFHCKGALFTAIRRLKDSSGRADWRIYYGANADDPGDYRPGLKAATLAGAEAPLLDAGLGKAAIRALAREYGLGEIAEKPATPCLSSRIPYGRRIDAKDLARVEEAEEYLRSLGLVEFRVRHHGEVARLEARPADFALLLAKREEITAALKAKGYAFVALDLAGFRSGSLNALIGESR